MVNRFPTKKCSPHNFSKCVCERQKKGGGVVTLGTDDFFDEGATKTRFFKFTKTLLLPAACRLCPLAPFWLFQYLQLPSCFFFSGRFSMQVKPLPQCRNGPRKTYRSALLFQVVCWAVFKFSKLCPLYACPWMSMHSIFPLPKHLDGFFTVDLNLGFFCVHD